MKQPRRKVQVPESERRPRPELVLLAGDSAPSRERTRKEGSLEDSAGIRIEVIDGSVVWSM